MATFQVSQTADGGLNSGSLRDAVLQANTTPEDDVIELAAGTYELSIEGTKENEGFTGDLDFIGGGTLTIRGLGEGATIDANQIDRVLDTNNGTLILENITVTGGNTDNGAGGIFSGGTLSLIDSNVSGNSTTGKGGGIYNVAGEVELIDSTVSNNSASEDGGGIYNGADFNLASSDTGAITLERSSIFDNSTETHGGGIFSASGNVTLTDSNLSNNNANGSGGGVFIEDIDTAAPPLTSLTLNNSSIELNSAGERGGGIFGRSVVSNLFGLENNQINLNNSTIAENNSVNDGGGINIIDFQANINNSTISNNIVSDGNGGGIAIGTKDPRRQGEATILNSIISGNQASQEGGGIFNVSGAIIEQSTVSNNIAGTNGGGIFTFISVNVFETTIDSNTANNGGGFFIDSPAVESSSRAIFLNSTVSNNQAINDGGGVFTANFSETNLQNTTISNNQANNDGGGVFNEPAIGAGTVGGVASGGPGGTTNLQNTTITQNIADFDANEEGNGGGIFNAGGRNGIFIDVPGAFNSRNTIIAGNLDNSSGEKHPDISGGVTGNNYNLVGNLIGTDLSGVAADFGGTIGTGSDIVEPNVNLTALQDNGGATFTHALTGGSVAIDAGNNSLIFSDRFDLDNDGNSEESFPFDQRDRSRILNNTVDIGAVEFNSETDGNLDPDSSDGNDTEDETIELYRFRNTNFATGTYIFVSETEKETIENDDELNRVFELEGDGEPAFIASRNEGEDLSAFYRFQSTITPGTYIFVGEQERQGINENFADSFVEEGLAFYVYGADTGRGTTFNRFQNKNNGTYLFAGPNETSTIEGNTDFSNVFTNEGVAFGSLG